MIGPAIVAALAGCGGGSAPKTHAGEAAAAALVAELDHAATVTAPWRCAALDPTPPVTAPTPIEAGGRRWMPAELGLAADGPTLRMAAIADARGVADPRLRPALRAAEVDLVVTLGGMGTTEAELTTSLGAVLDPAWLTVAVPGSTEAWPAHRAAIAALAATGAPIVDGATVRLLDGGGAVIATLPGDGFRQRLAADAEGCGHELADVVAITTAAARAAADRPAVLASPRPARVGDGDRVAPGIHAGDPALGAAVAALALVIHAPIDGRPAASDGDRTQTTASVNAGSLDPVPRYGTDGVVIPTSVTIVVAERNTVRWYPVVLADR